MRNIKQTNIIDQAPLEKLKWSISKQNPRGTLKKEYSKIKWDLFQEGKGSLVLGNWFM